MDAASENTLSRLEAQISELSSVVRVLSTNPSLADSDDRSEVDGAIIVFKAALHELPQTDSLYVGYNNGRWLQVRRLDVLDPTERLKLGAPAGAVYNVKKLATPANAPPRHPDRHCATAVFPLTILCFPGAHHYVIPDRLPPRKWRPGWRVAVSEHVVCAGTRI